MPGEGHEYSATLVLRGLPALGRSVAELQATMLAKGDPRSAAKLRARYVELVNTMTLISRETARLAQVEIRKAERTSRVRASKTGAAGEARLQDQLGKSHSLGPGNVGINFEPDLYQATPWWWTNEEGYAGHIGREIFGNFYAPGFRSASRPNMDEFRKGAQFRPESGGGRGVIQNPIPARRFVKTGLEEARVHWKVRVRLARDDFVKDCARIVAASKDIPAAKKRPRAPRPGRRL